MRAYIQLVMMASLVVVHIPLVPSMPPVSRTIQGPTVTAPIFWILIGVIVFLLLLAILFSTLYLVLRCRNPTRLPPRRHLNTVRLPPLTNTQTNPTPPKFSKFHPLDPSPSTSASTFIPASTRHHAPSTSTPPSHKPHTTPATSSSIPIPRFTPTHNHHHHHHDNSWPLPLPPKPSPIAAQPPQPPQPPPPMRPAAHPASKPPVPFPVGPPPRPLNRSELHARNAQLAALARVSSSSSSPPGQGKRNNVVTNTNTNTDFPAFRPSRLGGGGGFPESNTTETSEMDLERRGPEVNAAYARWREMRRREMGGEMGREGGMGMGMGMGNTGGSESESGGGFVLGVGVGAGEDWRGSGRGYARGRGEGRSTEWWGLWNGDADADADAAGVKVGEGGKVGVPVEVPRPLVVRKMKMGGR